MTKEQTQSLKFLTDDLIQAEAACIKASSQRTDAESKLVHFIDSLAEPAKRKYTRRAAENKEEITK